MHVQSHHLPYLYNQQMQQHKLYTTHHISPMEGGSTSSQAFMPVGCGYGPIAIEKSFRECSISPEKPRVASGSVQNLGSWVGVDFDSNMKMGYHDQTQAQDNDEENISTDIETLPLFPIHGGSTTSSGIHHDFFNMKESSEYGNGGYYTGGNWFRSDSLTSLELSLNSYGYYN
ncbi:Homeodomain-containing protein [Artemisia annua]|uniref:Homeodomain-containing protein n=1 Tax=Artemisia annua TaxID=35608 RepID=A0A2U1PTB0_ARTAN|nr:Homeodomain-containing protein [Artemisia annua]